MNETYDEYFNRLKELKNPKGSPIIKSKENVDRFWDDGDSLSDLEKLFSYEDSQGNEKFFSSTVLRHKDLGYSIQDLLRVAELKDSEGNVIIDNAVYLPDRKLKRSDFEAALEMFSIKDLEGKTVFRDEHYAGYQGGFDGVAEYLNVGGNIDFARKLIEIKNDDGKSVFETPREIIRFAKHNGTLDYAEEILSLKDSHGKQIFEEFYLALFKKVEGEISYAKELSDIVDSDGRVVFSSGEGIYEFYDRFKDIELAKEFVGVENSQGTVFRSGKDIVSFLKTGEDIDIAKDFAALEDFNGADIALFNKNKVPVSYVKKMSEFGLNADTILYYHMLGMGPDDVEYADNGKPKALVLYPTYDPEQFLGSVFSDEDAVNFLKNLKDNYDFKIRTISSVPEMKEELSNNSNLEFLALGGHGSSKTLRFGKSNLNYNIEIPEEDAILSVENGDISKYMNSVKKNGVIFLDSCLNGEGTDSANNMANYIASNARGRKVISSIDSFNARNIKVDSYYPFDAKIVKYDCFDKTYTVVK